MQMWKGSSHSKVQVESVRIRQPDSKRMNIHSNINHCWCVNVIHPINRLSLFHEPCETGAAVCRVVGLSGILNWTRHSYLHLHCVSRATAFPFSAWQYPSFLFISRRSGWRKWITGLSRRGTGAITEVCEKRNFDMWGLLTLYSSWTLGVCYGTSHCKTVAPKANRPAGVISSAHLFLLWLHLPPTFAQTIYFLLFSHTKLPDRLPSVTSIYITNDITEENTIRPKSL